MACITQLMRGVKLLGWPVLVLASALAGCRAADPAPTSSPDLLRVLSAAAAPKEAAAADSASAKARWSDTQRFYEARNRTFAWLGSAGPTETTSRALATIAAASAHGLPPARYDYESLAAQGSALNQPAADAEQATRAAALAAFDVRVTLALLALGRDVATGRQAPKVIDARWNARRAAPDYVAALSSARDPMAFLEAVQPRHPEYEALKKALAALRGQATVGWPRVPRATLTVGQWNAQAVVPLRQRLAAAGYLGQSAVTDSAQFDADVETGVKLFQEHHALPATGRLDAATVGKLNIALDSRIRQVEMNLERWRWLPDNLGERHFFVNVPYFHLVARESGRPVLDMRVVVGKRGNETPLFTDEMETVVFSPYWNIPDTIALEETAPAIARDSNYLERNNMEVVDAAGRVLDPDDISWSDERALQRYRFRQRPGADNALGFVKFLFPNEHSVYLHDTPADALFRRIGRAFSHGCVRVEEPETLARYVLRDQQEWTADAIHTAMRSGNERHVKLPTPIPVHIVYLTSWVDDKGGLHFQDDVYGYDAQQARVH